MEKSKCLFESIVAANRQLVPLRRAWGITLSLRFLMCAVRFRRAALSSATADFSNPLKNKSLWATLFFFAAVITLWLQLYAPLVTGLQFPRRALSSFRQAKISR